MWLVCNHNPAMGSRAITTMCFSLRLLVLRVSIDDKPSEHVVNDNALVAGLHLAGERILDPDPMVAKRRWSQGLTQVVE